MNLEFLVNYYSVDHLQVPTSISSLLAYSAFIQTILDLTYVLLHLISVSKFNSFNFFHSVEFN